MGLNEISALDVINNLSETNLKSVIKILGEEREAFKIAKNIVKYRNLKKSVSRNLEGMINVLPGNINLRHKVKKFKRKFIS